MEKSLFLFLSLSKKCASDFRRLTANENKQFIQSKNIDIYIDFCMEGDLKSGLSLDKINFALKIPNIPPPYAVYACIIEQFGIEGGGGIIWIIHRVKLG